MESCLCCQGGAQSRITDEKKYRKSCCIIYYISFSKCNRYRWSPIWSQRYGTLLRDSCSGRSLRRMCLNHLKTYAESVVVTVYVNTQSLRYWALIIWQDYTLLLCPAILRTQRLHFTWTLVIINESRSRKTLPKEIFTFCCIYWRLSQTASFKIC